MAAHLLGFVGLDSRGKDKGYYGLEGYYNLELSGRPGVIRQEKDAFNQPILSGDFSAQSKKDGRDLKLNVDRGLQFIVEKKLASGVERYGARAGSVTIMDPNSGAVLAMASLPGYDPAEYNRYETENYSNPVVRDAFEPGSIFKVMVMAAAIDSGVVKPETICDICDGPAKIDKYEIKTWNNEYYPNSTMSEVIIHSDNVGMVFTGQKLGVDRFVDYFHRFGFTESTGIDLEDEIVPQPKADKDWTYVDVATGSFGQGFLATGMQLLTAVSAIANGGELVQPRLVKEIISEGHGVALPKKSKHRVISQGAANQVRDIMVAAASSGEAKWADIKGYKIAGKTGTAQVAVGGKYAEEKTNASFVGFAPADNPKFAMLVTLKEPSSSPWASETAAPLWFSIAQDLFNHFNVVPREP
jgi:cell division protein FtsI/penicillin-binding protein 2